MFSQPASPAYSIHELSVSFDRAASISFFVRLLLSRLLLLVKVG